jgi:ketosteroid isomerase-like protein
MVPLAPSDGLAYAASGAARALASAHESLARIRPHQSSYRRGISSVWKLTHKLWYAQGWHGCKCPACILGPMSANVDLVRSIYAAWERGDYSSVEWADPEIEFVGADGPDPSSSRGLAAMVEGWRDFLSETWEGYRFQAQDFRQIDSERVLVLIQISARGRASGLELAQVRSQGATVLHVRDGKVIRLVLYWDSQCALADLGLAPEVP